MEILKYSAIILLSIGALTILLFCLKSRRPIRNLFLNAFLGLIALTVIDLTTGFTGVHIPVNGWTAGGSALYGLPALCGFVILQTIFR